MKKAVVVFSVGLFLVLCVMFVRTGFAISVPCEQSSECRGQPNYRATPCGDWCSLTELQQPDEWLYARQEREMHQRWYGVEGARMIRMKLEGVQFDFDKSNLREDTIPILKRNIAKLKDMPVNRINVIGYTDSKGTDEYNQVLSVKRAQIVKDYLVEAGIASNRITVEGRGESGEIAPNVTPSGADYPAGRAKNRRAIELQIWTE